ncbi:RNA polymerase sigma factor [Pseudonocardia oroxyli]|uniref:RNA polymerase sigma factor, sigma-70 family n=1 Tax=Pseudonocardia oroxyli TaxID=366584 RepID=A0A1G7S6L2_PSEOR|nr:sigma-70 family RNA polymerase sigma factor [Pseudonocardia oroxyli]SDG18666.1 RNA polymerase sigma factor, sigma-70 family [Pseudonocardia oroxyli]
MTGRVEDLLRECAPQVLGALVRRHRQFDLCEDAVQEALLAAAQQWPGEGVPQNPHGWLVAVGHRRVIDAVRSERASRAREERLALLEPPPAQAPDTDDTLTLLGLCCHPALSPPSRIALTLRAVGGLTTAEIAGAFLVPEATMAQRISRARKTLRGREFDTPGDVSHVLYLMFNEGYTASGGDELARVDLSTEAIRLTRMLPPTPETTGLLALMLLTDARRPARTDAAGDLVPLAEQDRALWDAAKIAEGTALVERAIASGPLGPYQLQAAIAALHAEPGETDWRQIVGLYELLDRIAPSPVVTLNRAVALAELRGPDAGLDLLRDLDLPGHRLPAVRAHLHERAGRREQAEADYRLAASLTRSLPERRYLERRAKHTREWR